MAQYYEDFVSYTTGPLAGTTNWTTRLALGAAQTNIVPDDTTGRPLMRIQGGSSGSRLNSYNPLDNATDIESLVRFRVNGVDTGRQGIVAHRYSGTSEATTAGYALQFVPASDVKSLLISNDQTGVTLNFTNYAWTINTIYWARFRTVGTVIQAKIWQDGSPEPATWTLDSVDTAFTGGPGTYNGVCTFSPNSYGVDYLQYSAATEGDTAPSGPTLVIADSLHLHTADKIEAASPSSTPMVGYSGGYGGPFSGYGSALGLALENTELVIASTSHSHTAGGVAVTQVHKTAIANASHWHAADSPIIKQAHGLTIADALHAHLATSASVTENYNLSVNNVAHSLSSDNLVLVTGFAAVPQDALNSLTSDNVNIVQAQTLVVSNTTHVHTSTTLDIVEAKILLIDDTAHSVIDSIGDLSQVHNLAAANTTHSHTADGNLAILQNQLLAIANAVHATSSDHVSIIHFTLLGKPDDGVFDVSDTSTNLVQQHTLEAQSTSHFFKSDTIIKIINWSELGFDYGYYIPNNPRGGSLEAANGVQQGFIAPNAISRGTFELVDVNDGRYIPDNIETGNF